MRLRIFQIECDRCSADIWDRYSSSVQAQAKAEGWRLSKAEDVCPECVYDEATGEG